MIHIIDTPKDNLIATTLQGKLSKSDVEKIHSRMHKVLEDNKKIDFYFEMHDFHGYDLKGFWEDLKVDFNHLADYGKMAFVGDKKWQEWAAKATNLFTSSEVKHFELNEKDKARLWIGFEN